MNVGTTEPFRREMALPDETRVVAETEFEKPRGINKVEIRKGYVTVHVSGLNNGNLTASRLAVLQSMAKANVSIDFLKFTQNGLAFVVPEQLAETAAQALAGVEHHLNRDRCIVLAHAANMRDEEGLIARVVSETISTGVVIDHLGDMHDRVLMVMDANDGERVARHIEDRLVER